MAEDNHDLGFNTFVAFSVDLSEESDRAAVVLGAARIDLGLRRLLEHALAPNTSSRDDLLDNDGPVSTFSARTQLCLRLRLITPEFARAINIMRRIRNDFAHEASGATLVGGAHADRVHELALPFLQLPRYAEFREKYFSKFVGARREFRAVASVLVMRLAGFDLYIRPVTSRVAISLFPPHWVGEGAEPEPPLK